MFIRQASVDDTEAIHDIGCRSYRGNFLNVWSPQGLEDHLRESFSQTIIRESLQQRKHLWFLLSVSPKDRPLGFAALVANSPIPHQEEMGLELQKLYFLPEATGGGCGRYFMDYVIQYAQENNYLKVWLDVLKSNTRAISFYRTQGFEQSGELPFKTDLSDVGQYVMVRSI